MLIVRVYLKVSRYVSVMVVMIICRPIGRRHSIIPRSFAS